MQIKHIHFWEEDMNRHQSLLSYTATLALLLAVVTLTGGCKSTLPENRDVQKDARAQQQFNNRMQTYVSVHRREAQSYPHIKPSHSGANIVQQQATLAERIQATHTAEEGKVFTPDVSAYFHRQIEAAYMANSGAIQASLETTEPDGVQGGGNVVVNQPFPESVSHRSMPPTILLRLPRLPNCFQYEIANRDLVIRDMESNLVVDVLRDVIPA
jgi:hypothetical protein